MTIQEIINNLSEIESTLFYLYSGGTKESPIKYEDAEKLHKATKKLLLQFVQTTGILPKEDPAEINKKIETAERLQAYIDPFSYTAEDIIQEISTTSGALETINYLLNEMEENN